MEVLLAEKWRMRRRVDSRRENALINPIA